MLGLSEAAQIELIKQSPLIIGGLLSGLCAFGTLVLSFLNRATLKDQASKLEAVHVATNSIVAARVDAAKDEGRIAERDDQRERAT